MLIKRYSKFVPEVKPKYLVTLSYYFHCKN